MGECALRKEDCTGEADDFGCPGAGVALTLEKEGADSEAFRGAAGGGASADISVISARGSAAGISLEVISSGDDLTEVIPEDGGAVLRFCSGWDADGCPGIATRTANGRTAGFAEPWGGGDDAGVLEGSADSIDRGDDVKRTVGPLGLGCGRVC
ncbi:MAG: hypothetical protein R3E60_02700 [Alphaproteobacteria bacterium]